MPSLKPARPKLRAHTASHFGRWQTILYRI